MQVLLALVETAGRVITRDQLLAAAWPGVVVGDEALTQTIIKLRRALGDNPRSPAYIETISKRGYRLVAQVRQSGDSRAAAPEVVVAAAPESAPAPIPSRSRWRSAALAACGVVLAAFAAALLVPGERAGGDVNRFSFEDARGQAALTVAVLPFEASGAGDDQAYLARGIGEDLMTELSRLPGLRLVRASGAGGGAAPGARYVVAGNVQRNAGLLRIHIRMIDAVTRQQLWAERFERPFGDLFAVQDEIVRKLTAQLPGQLQDAARQRAAKRYTRSLEAYDHFLHAQALFLVRQAGDNEEARAYYRKALSFDPRFARAYAGLAMTYALDNRLRPQEDAPATRARAFELAESARLIDPEIPEVYWALAFVHAQSGRHDEAIRQLERAIELNRSFADAYAFMGGIYTYVGQSARTIPLLRTALRLNPDGGYLYFLILGRAFLFENDLEQALINLREAAQRNPMDLETRLYLAAALAAARQARDAEWESVEVRAIDADFSLERWLRAYPMRDAGNRARLAALLAQAGL
jgi:TolB-like protein/Flp pilus assembly protein TadD